MIIWNKSHVFSGLGILRSLLKDGEARCGEWTNFFQHIPLSQGLSVGNGTIGICTEAGALFGFETNPRIPGSYSQTTSSYRQVPISLQFAVKPRLRVRNFKR